MPEPARSSSSTRRIAGQDQGAALPGQDPPVFRGGRGPQRRLRPWSACGSFNPTSVPRTSDCPLDGFEGSSSSWRRRAPTWCSPRPSISLPSRPSRPTRWDYLLTHRPGQLSGRLGVAPGPFQRREGRTGIDKGAAGGPGETPPGTAGGEGGRTAGSPISLRTVWRLSRKARQVRVHSTRVSTPAAQPP